jgi:Ca2+-binding RTX toxin-like protein
VFRLPSRAVRAALGASLVVFAFVGPGPRPVAAAEDTGTVNVVQVSNPEGDAVFNYRFQSGGSYEEFSLDDDGGNDSTLEDTKSFSNIAAGAYEVRQFEPPMGWALTYLDCNDPDGGTDIYSDKAVIDLDPGEYITCFFTDQRTTGNVAIHQRTTPQDPVAFTFETSWAYTVTLNDDGSDQDFIWPDMSAEGLTPGIYTVTQQPVAGWPIQNIQCTDPDNETFVDLNAGTVSLDVDAGENLDCTFENMPSGAPETGDVTINLDAVPDNGVDVSFGGDFGSFALDDDSDVTLSNSVSFQDVAPGSRTVTAVLPTGWLFSDFGCSDPDGGTSSDPAARTLTIDVDAGEAIDCLIRIVPAPLPNQVNITLDMQPNDAVDVLFDFGASQTFTLDDDSASPFTNGKEYNNLDLGSWPTTAHVPAGWRVQTIACTDPDNGTTVDTAAAKATIDLDDGEVVWCTFTLEPIPAAPPPPAPKCNGLDATIVGGVGATTIRGTAGNDVIVDLDGANRIDGRGGNDTICTGAGADVISGGDGNDVIFAGDGKNRVDGGNGDDIVMTMGGDDTLAGGAGADALYAGPGNNSLSGGTGNDGLSAGDGNDKIDGGKDFDTALPGLGINTVRNCEA